MSGCMATMWAVFGLFQSALLFIIIGAVFDFFDGFAARLLHVSSPIGKELDSLADVVTFGVAPTTMLCMWVAYHSNIGGPYIGMLPLLMAAFSALRLAKFNLDERQTMGFIGMPTPANALFWGDLLTGWGRQLEQFQPAVPVLLVLMLLSCYLLVSEIPMFALKFKTWDWKNNAVRYIFLITSLFLLVVFPLTGLMDSVQAVPIVIAWYLLLSVATAHKGKA